MCLARQTYAAASRLPMHETHGLGSQMRRAAVSVPSNIAEGYGRASLREYLRYLSFANGSLLELETQVILARDVGYLSEAEGADLLEAASQVGRMLARMTAALRRKALGYKP